MKCFFKTILLAFFAMLCIGNAKAQKNIAINLQNVILASDGFSATFELWVTAQSSYVGNAAGWDTLYYRADASVGTYNIGSVNLLPTAAVDANATAYITNPVPPPVGSSKFGLTFTRSGGKPDLIIGAPVKFGTVTLHFNLPIKSGSATIVSRSPPTYAATASTYYTNGDGADYYIAASTNNVLPIDIISFTGIRSSNSNLLNWITANAVNFDHFELQRSVDGNNFISIAKILPNNTGVYAYKDANIISTYFYRLAAIDVDGNLQYSNIIAILSNVSNFIVANIYPVPANNVLNVALYVPTNTDVLYTITDLNGQPIITEKHTELQTATRKLNITNLASGTYLITIQTELGKQCAKFIKI